MEPQILGFELYSSHPEALERFLSDVLSLDIESGEGMFRVQLGQLGMTVQKGDGPGIKMQIALSVESYFDLPARFEFFCFRHEDRPQVIWHKNKSVFVTKDGHEWSVIASQSLFPHESLDSCVRNF